MPAKIRDIEKTDDFSMSTSVILFHALGSSYSQRVLLALHEKEIDFDSCLIDLYVGEHLEQFFVNLNAKAEVPVLVDGKKIVVESSKILDYLDEKYSDGDYPRLIPAEGTEEFDKVVKIRKLLEPLPIPIMTFGAVYHTHLAVNPKMTDIEKQLRMNALKSSSGLVDSFIIKHPEFEEIYKEKKEKFGSFFSAIQDVNFVKGGLKKFENAFDLVEEELTKNDGDWWLCGPNFTIADIMLVVILHRVEHLGLITWFFQDGKHTNLLKYYERVQHRESYIETFKFDFVDDDLSGGILSYTTLIVALGLIVFAIVAACAHIKNH